MPLLPDPTNVLIAEPSEIIRKGIETMLGEYKEIKTYCVKTATEAIQLAPYFNPHAVLMNSALPGMPACDYVTQMKECVPHAPLIMLMDKTDARTVHELMRSVKKLMKVNLLLLNDFTAKEKQNGCTGFVTVTTTAAELYEAITTTLSGRLYFSAPIAQEVAVHIFQDIYDGLTTEKIAEKHFRSAKTIEKRLTNIYKKTKTINRQQLIAYILRKGLLVDPEI